ncbi:hypothetical protein O3P69_006037 [Scylla paramamosain]|uniref:Vitellogenin domain-containing protein n=1 Tax=Scylla paramamosain TaxID=85552 RepID=A0AAW0U4L6_SCYPA
MSQVVDGNAVSGLHTHGSPSPTPHLYLRPHVPLITCRAQRERGGGRYSEVIRYSVGNGQKEGGGGGTSGSESLIRQVTKPPLGHALTVMPQPGVCHTMTRCSSLASGLSEARLVATVGSGRISRDTDLHTLSPVSTAVPVNCPHPAHPRRGDGVGRVSRYLGPAWGRQSLLALMMSRKGQQAPPGGTSTLRTPCTHYVRRAAEERVWPISGQRANMRLLVVAAVLLAAMSSAGSSETMCAKTCSLSGEGQTTYQAGQQYVYLYRGEAATTTAGDHQESSISVAARVIVTVGASPCDLKLQVPSFEVEGDSAWFKEAVQAHDLYFSYQGGRIEEVCPHQEEPVAATNFKRAVLSMLHTSVTNPPTKVIVHESDVAGECETHYHLMKSEDDTVVLNKTKHDCLSNVHLPHLLHSHSHSLSPTMAVMPHFRSKQECQMESQRGVWQTVDCQQEVKVDGPLAPSKDSVTLSMSSSLVLETSGPDGNQQAFHQDQILKRESLRMNLEEAVMGGQAQEASHILAQVADTMEVLAKEEGRKEVEWPRMFSHLVNLMSLVQHEQDLEEIWDDYSDQDNYKNIVLDGLLACDSGPCIALVTRLASEAPSPLSSTTLSLWLAGLHLHTHADPSSIPHIMSLGESRPESEEAAVMAASSVVFRVCQKNQTACHTHSQTFLKYVKEEVGEECGWGQTSQQQHRVKFALRALGNAGVVPQGNFPEKCYKSKMLPTELRVAALQTLRRGGCSGSEAPWKILEDESDGVEVRVAAYLALQPCATVTPQFFPRLQKLLEKEQVNQVGSFIWTHVHNLAEQPAANQEGQQLARLAAQLTLNNKFNTNPFQASRNYRLAQFSEAMGFGGIVDGNIVFSPESYLPQTAALNLTLQLLGKSVNVFEIGGNFKRMEDYVSGIERFFEKGNYFENEDLKSLLKNLRPKREMSVDKLEGYQTMYNEAKMKKEAIEGRDEEPKTSLYLRVFGNEMLHSENVLKSDPLKVLQETLQHLSSPRAFQVMNQEFVTPTLLGFPLRLKYNVTGSLSLDKEGRVQAVSPGQLLLEGKLSPTVAVTSDETLLLDGYGFHSGIRRSTTHHAHSHFGGKVNIQDGRVVDVQLDLPKTEVVKIYSSVKIALYSNTDQGWSDLATHSDTEESEGCSSKALSDIIGLQVCHVERSTKQFTDTDISSSEPYEKKIVISKTDNFDKFVFSLRKAENAFEAVVDTPGSSVDRRVSVVVNSHGNGMDSTIVVPRRKVGGEYEWSPTLKKVALKYYQDSDVHGELDISLQGVKEGPNMRHTPHIVLSWPGLLEVRANGSLLLGPQTLSWNGTFMSNLQSQPAVSQGHWEVMNEQHQASCRVSVEQYFASISGSVLRESAMTVVEAKSEYGTKSAQPNMLSFSAHFTEKLENRDTSLQGHISIQSSQAKASVDMDVRHQPGHTAINASLSLPSAEINSTFVAKNIGEEGKRDFEMAFSLFSHQLALNYLGRTLYKISDGDFQAEAELRLGTLGYTKMSVSHLLQCHPFHALAGLHLQFNDHLLQAGYNLDLSRPDQTEIMVSGAVGGASAVLHMEAQHAHTRPFRGLVKVFGGYNEKQVGVMLRTTSDDAWQSFSGSMELTWFERLYVVRHEALWNDGRKGITFSHEQSSFQLMYESSLSPRVLLVVKSSIYPTLQVVAEKTENAQSKTYQAYVMQGADQPLHIGATWNKDESFSGSLRLLKSEVKLSGSLRRPHHHHVEGSAQVTVILPSSETFTTDFTLTHAYDGITREVNVSTISNGHKYEGNFKLKQYDGWFSNDSVGLTVNLTTPLAGLHSAALVVETHSDPSQFSFIQLEVEEIKIRGEAQVGDSAKLFDVKLQYEAGHGNCDSHIHLYHKYVYEKYLTGATVKLTQEHDPWDLQVVTTLGNTHGKKSLDVEFTSPLLSSPLHFLANYSSSETHFDLKLIGGMENQASLTVSGKNDLQDNTQIYGGTFDLQTPWTSPLFINVSHLHGDHRLNTTLDFHSAWHPVNTVSVDFGVIFVNSSDLNVNFQLNHEYLQVAMDLGHRLMKGELRNELEFSANVVRVTCKIISTWDENFVPQSATGHLSVISKVENPIDLSFSFIKGISDYHTQLIASHGSSLLRVEHQLQAHHLTDWQSELSVVFPNREDVIENKMSLNVMPSLSSVKWKFSIKSPWTKEIKSEFSSLTGPLEEWKASLTHDPGPSSLPNLRLNVTKDGTDIFTFGSKFTESKEFKAHVIPGNRKKYQVMAHVDASVFKIDSQVVSEDAPPFKVITGDVSWIFRRRGQLIRIDLNSDFSMIQNIKGIIGIQRRRRVGVSAKVMVNEAEFNGNVTYIPARPRSPARVNVEVDNKVLVPFKANLNLTYSLSSRNLESYLAIDLNEQKNWLVSDTKHYHVKLTHKTEGNDHHFSIRSIQDDVELEMEASFLARVEGFSPSFRIKTPFKVLETLHVSLGFPHSDSPGNLYTFDISGMTMLALGAQLNTQPQGAPVPWRKLELDVLFESSLTLTHHLHAEYEVNTWTLSSWYKHGLDHFHFKLVPKLKRKVGTLTVTGNIPIRGLSTFNLDFSYKLKEDYTASLTASVEETNLIFSVELEPRRSWSSLKASLTSPFFRPMRASLLWTFKELPWLVESSMTYGDHVGELKIKANPYGNSSYLNAKLTLSQVEIEFFWNKETYLNMSGSLTPHNDGYDLHLTLESSETLPVMLKSRYLHKHGQEATASLSVGEKEYNVSVKGDVSKKSSSLELYLYSSESPYTPITFKAEYNLREYLHGRMTSMMDLASLTFEWGEKIQLLVQGMQTRDQSKMKFEMLTPFRSLPMLTFGYDAEFSLARSNIEVMCTTFVEWSHRITLSGIFKLVNGNVDTFVGLTSSYSDLEMFNASLKFNSSHIEATVTVNKDKWNMTCEYKLYPFSVEISVNTPLEGYKKFFLAASGSLRGGRFAAEAEMTWTNTIRVQVEAELWDLDIKVQTPWSLLPEASLKMSLRTESEALMYTVTAHWNHSTVVSLNYLISPDDRKANIIVRSEFAHTWMESFNLNIVITYDGTSLEASSSAEWKPRGKELTNLNGGLTCTINKKHLSMEVKLEGSCFEHPVKLTCKIPLFNFFIKEGAFEFAFIHEETYKVTYDTTNRHEVYPHHHLTISIPEWSCAVELILTEESLNLSAFFPDSATRHTLSVKWPQLSLEKFAAQLELHSPYLPQEGVAINGSLEVRRKLSFSFNSAASYGQHFIAASGTLHYVKKLHELQCEGKIKSNWIDNYQVAVNVQWLRNIKANIQFAVADEEHTCSLAIDVTNYTLELKCDSSWLPYGNCTIKGKLNNDVSIFSIKAEGELVGFTEGKSLLIEASDLTFKMQLPSDKNTELLKLHLRGKDNQQSRVDIHCYPDPVMKWSVWVAVLTPLSGFEKFQLMTPQFNYQGHIFRALVEYPGGKLRYDEYKEFYFIAKSDSEEILKGHWSWGEAKIFSLTTPRMYPGYVVFHLESGPVVQDCQMKASLSTALGGSGLPYGFHVHHRQLESGHHISAFGLAPQTRFHLQGTHHMNSNLLNESLTIEVNKKQVGYNICLQRHPGSVHQHLHWRNGLNAASSQCSLQYFCNISHQSNRFFIDAYMG